MRFLPLLLSAFITLPAFADRLTIERLHADPALSGPGVRLLQMAPDGSRVTFLKGRADDQFQLDLWEFNLHDKSTRRLVDSKALQPEENISEAEKARRERERTASYHGIGDYSWSPDGKQLLVTLAGNLYLVDAAHPEHAKRLAAGDVIDPQILAQGAFRLLRARAEPRCHRSGLRLRTQIDQRRRRHATQRRSRIHRTGEMAQTSGYWWAPDDSAIAFKHFDEAQVPVARRFEIYPNRTEVIEQRYPGAGEANVVVGLSIVSPTTAVQRPIDLGVEKDIYLVRADWSSDARELVYQRESRDQKRLDLVGVDAASLAQQYAALGNVIHLDPCRRRAALSGAQQAFIWASERSGRKHLYLFDLDGHLLHPILPVNGASTTCCPSMKNWPRICCVESRCRHRQASVFACARWQQRGPSAARDEA